MFRKLLYHLIYPNSVWKEILKYGVFRGSDAQRERVLFRARILRDCAMERSPMDGLSTNTIEGVFPGKFPTTCTMQYTSQRAFNVSWDELLILSSLTAITQPKRVFEFGTFDGRTTMHLALNGPQDCRIESLDIMQGEFPFDDESPLAETLDIGEYANDYVRSGRVTLHCSDSTKFDYAPYTNSMDLIFVDGGHAYDIVMNDSRAAFSMLRKGGTIIWHDYLLLEDVTNALIEINRERTLVRISGTSLAVYRDVT